MPTKADETWEVMPMTTDMTDKTVTVGMKQYPWGRSGAFHVKDEGEAHAIQDKYGHKVIVDKVRVPHVSDRGHRYFFGQMPALPWHKYDELGRRVDNGAQESTEQE